MSKKTTEFYSEIDQLLDQQEFTESIRRDFQEISDPRVLDNQSYPLVSLLTMILAAILAGANTINQIHQYASLKIYIFRRLLGVEQSPSYLVFWWLLVRLDSQKLQEAFLQWIKKLPVTIQERVIAIDGKRLNGASKQIVHLVSAWETGRGLLLGQVKTEEKSNEITAIPELLNVIDLKGATITIDAAGAQKKIVDTIREKEGDYLIALKGNQGRLHDEAKNFFAQARDVEHEDCACLLERTIEKAHGRVEEREAVVTSHLDWLDCREEWRDLIIPGDYNATLIFCLQHFIAIAKESIQDHGLFFVALSGGSTPKTLFEHLCKPPYVEEIDWQKVHLFWSDERAVPPDHPESNYRMAMEAGFNTLGIPPTHIHRMQAETEIEKNAHLYEEEIKKTLNERPLDLIMLGMGDDGHTASLFPHTQGLTSTDRWIIANYLTEKKLWRMSMTFSCINQARYRALYVLGASKKYMLAQVLTSPEQVDLLPAQGVGTPTNKALWITDEAAAALLSTIFFDFT